MALCWWVHNSLYHILTSASPGLGLLLAAVCSPCETGLQTSFLNLSSVYPRPCCRTQAALKRGVFRVGGTSGDADRFSQRVVLRALMRTARDVARGMQHLHASGGLPHRASVCSGLGGEDLACLKGSSTAV